MIDAMKMIDAQTRKTRNAGGVMLEEVNDHIGENKMTRRSRNVANLSISRRESLTTGVAIEIANEVGWSSVIRWRLVAHLCLKIWILR
jgi:hypothetical protein